MNILEKEVKKLDIKRLKSRRVMVMGRIEHVEQIIRLLHAQSIAVEAVLDNDKKKQGLYAVQIPILPPAHALVPFQDDVSILIYSPKYWEDMCTQLAGYGYQEKKHISILDKPGISKNIRLVIKGAAIYRKLQKQYGKNVTVFLANCPLGDYYLLGAYFHQYCKQNRITHYIVTGESKGIKKLSPMFGIAPVQPISTEESNALIRAWIFLGSDKIRLKPLTLWQGAFRFNPCRTRQTDGFNFMDTFSKMIYALEKPVPYYPAFLKNNEAVTAVFRKNGLQFQRTVILSPFSYSLQALPQEFWTALTCKLKEKGYSVAVNTGDAKERNFIDGTVTLCMNFAEIMDAMEQAGTVIGMRSGFFDITARAQCRRIILYPPTVKELTSWNSTNIEFCSLKSMGLRDDACEWEVNDIDEIFQKIIEIV